ncbi:MAG: hypothetical protein ACK5NK_13130 [Niabella sp.]
MAKLRQQGVSNVKGTYATPPLLANGRIDNSKLIKELKELNANTYNWLIWRSEFDWEDLQLFLPLAKKNNINVWVSLVPFSESKPKADRSSEPFGTDYVLWAEEIAKLSLKFTNLTALSIDDFVAWNLQFYTPDYTAEIVNRMHSVNPKLAFVPCIYYKSTKITDYTQQYTQYFDAVLFPYKAESSGKETLSSYDTFSDEIVYMKKYFGNKLPVIVDIYSTAHSKAGASSADYVSQIISLSKELGDGVFIYTHPNPDTVPDKYEAIKNGFK